MVPITSYHRAMLMVNMKCANDLKDERTASDLSLKAPRSALRDLCILVGRICLHGISIHEGIVARIVFCGALGSGGRSPGLLSQPTRITPRSSSLKGSRCLHIGPSKLSLTISGLGQTPFVERILLTNNDFSNYDVAHVKCSPQTHEIRLKTNSS